MRPDVILEDPVKVNFEILNGNLHFLLYILKTDVKAFSKHWLQTLFTWDLPKLPSL